MLLREFRGKTVLITGHTGFKGSWLTAWMKRLGANVVGIALDPQTNPSHFSVARLAEGITDHRLDVRDLASVNEAVQAAKPDYVFHLAAQALVRRSYEEPLYTWQTNVLGTLHILEALRNLRSPCSAVIITSDKCYENVEWLWGYRETDALGGADPYSGSKGAAELAVKSHVRSYFPRATSSVRIATARAGNVIGGGDWSADRIVPDCVRAWSASHPVELRNPQSTRPWQHVLEPLSGYLNLAVELSRRAELHGEAFNFGPAAQQEYCVLDLVRQMAQHWNEVRWVDASQSGPVPHEAGLLKLNCDKALHYLQWRPAMGFADTVRLTAEWYRAYFERPNQAAETTNAQIDVYMDIASQRGLAWAQ